MLKAAYDAGINTFDTADVYSNGRSEIILNKFLKQHAIPREKVVILTKCFGVVNEGNPSERIMTPGPADFVNEHGLSRKHIFDAVDASIRRLGTYIDVLQIHRLDQETEPEEIMRALHDVVLSGKVRYIGASSMWTWEFAQLQFTATLNHWTPFISMTNFYNLLYREEEREMIPFCKKTGVGIIPWSPIARGLLARPYKSSQTSESVRHTNDYMIKSAFLSKEEQYEGEIDRAIIDRVEQLAEHKGVSMATIATAWSLAKDCLPIIGLNKVERVTDALAALKVELTEEDVKYLEAPYAPKSVFGH